MRSAEKILRHVVRCDWRCKHCNEIFGSERINHYGVTLPELLKPTWFFASMTLLDHLRDCMKKDFSPELSAEYGKDFLNHALIYNWYNVHALVERHFLAEEEIE
jgi:hypothetical protein